MPTMKHGTRSTYNNYKCRCERCSEAQREYSRKRQEAVRTGAKEASHGLTGYTEGCRCDECRTARRQYIDRHNDKVKAEPIRHGTFYGYTIHKCRCDECRAWGQPHWRKSYLRRAYGLTPEDYEDMLDSQGGRCASCQDEFVDSLTTHIDHHHESGTVRALLCKNCNQALGLLFENPDRCRALAEYIERYN